jgi:quinol monooxygenase YgiN
MSEIVGMVDVRAAEGRADAVLAAFEACTVRTHEEDGCLLYAVHRDAADPHHFVVVERWRSQEDLDAHFTTPHVQELLAFAGAAGNLAEPPRMTFATPLRLGAPGKGSLQGDAA